MPIFDFKCTNCGYECDRLIVVNRDWPVCRCGHNMEKLPAAGSYRMKGFSEENSYGLKPVKE